MAGRTEPAEQLVSMPAAAAIAFLPDATDAVLLFIRHEPPDTGLDTARLLRPGESFLGVPFERLAAAGAGRIVPDGEGGWRIEAPGATGCQSDRRRR